MRGKAQAFYDMIKQITEEMQAKTSALTPGDLGIQPFQVLDLCMAPGGFTWGTLEYNPDAIAYGITIPPEIGGYKTWFTLSAEHVKYMDITMLASEFGIGTIPTSHPDHSLFLAERPSLINDSSSFSVAVQFLGVMTDLSTDKNSNERV
jgi:hypothetical protein